MDSSSTSTTRFRFRDHRRPEMDAASRSDTSSGMSSVSSDLDAEPDLHSMAGKGIKHLCSELLELKAESDEDFHRNIFSNHSSFVRIFDQVKGMENELMQLKGQVLTQKRLVKDLLDGIHLKVLSEETFDSILHESECAETSLPSELEVHVNNISETLEVLMLENRVDEAIDILAMEDENLQRMQLEDNSPADLLLSYDSAISEKKAMLTLQLTLSAENPRISAAELQKVLLRICRLGDSHLATHLLLKYYHSRIATGMHDLQSSQSFLDVLYVKELAKFVFSMVSQAARSFMMLYGEPSPHASELIQWAREQTKLFVSSFNKYVKSNSDISGGLSTAVSAMHFAISYCSLLKSQRLFLRPYLIKHIRPCMEEVLETHIDHLKKVISMFTETDTWVLGRYLISGILNEGNYRAVGQLQPEYCLLTNSGRKFLTLLQAVVADVTPLLAIQMEGSILKGLMNLFTDYMAILEKALTFETHVSKKSSRKTSAESLPEQISLLANLSTLQHFFFKIITSLFRGSGNMNLELRKTKLIDFQKKELDGCMLFIQEAEAQLRAHFCQQSINKMLSLETGSELMHETSPENQEEPSTFHDAMPSVAFQVLFLDLRKVDKLAEDNFFEDDWLMELLRELIEAIFSWIVNNKEIWRNTKKNTHAQLSDIISQFVLDIHFLAEIVQFGGYFSKKPLVLHSLVESAFTSAGLDPKRDIDSDGWAKNAAKEAVQKLLEIEKMQLLSKDDDGSDDILEDENEFESDQNDPVQDESGGNSMLDEEDPPSTVTDEVEVAVTAAAGSPSKESLSLLSDDNVEDNNISVDQSGVVSTGNSGELLEDVESGNNGVSKACDELHLRDNTDLPDPSSSDSTSEASEVRVPGPTNEADICQY